jgi:exopolysaccharide biosynthesis polyprenyl glycosylphosphotransferase
VLYGLVVPLTSTVQPEETLRAALAGRAGRRQVVPEPSRLLLQRLAPRLIRRHFVRASTRVLLLVSADALAILAARTVVRALRDHALLGVVTAEALRTVIPRGYLGGWQFVVALFIGLLFAGCYGRGTARRDQAQLFKAVAVGAGLALWQRIWVAPTPTAALQLGGTVVAMWASLAVERTVIDRIIRRVIQRSIGSERALFVGDKSDSSVQRMYERLDASKYVQPVQWVNVRAPGNGEVDEDPACTLDRIWGALEGSESETMVLCGEFPTRTLEVIVESASSGGIRVLSVSQLRGIARHRSGFVWYGDCPFVELAVPALKAWQLLVKRLLDIALSSLGLIVLAPVFAAIAVAIKLDSKGPVFFSQERVGYAGKVFRLLKFRTMHVGADAEKARLAHMNHTGDSRLFKIPNDPRVTRVGAVLRKWSLDELPQLVNVLRGEMSLVGPRPFFERDLQRYLDHHYARLGAKPGITGLWQVNGRSAVQDFEEVVRLDREYIDRWSLFLDLRILAQTLPAVVRKTGAY